MSFAGLWDSLLPIGRVPSTGGYRRFSWTPEDQRCRDWFTSAATERNLRTYSDGNGNLWAWWDSSGPTPGPAGAVAGSGGSPPRASTGTAGVTGPPGSGVSPGTAVASRASSAGGSGGSSPRVSRAAIVTGSHLDSVPDGGAFDGPLGVVSAFAAIDLLRSRGFAPARPIAVAAFSEEEGARFGVACLGSRLLTGAIRDRKSVV
jgi:N-carbamoyl-L-amino-acid hydrolase